jgi:hypothetical protein
MQSSLEFELLCFLAANEQFFRYLSTASAEYLRRDQDYSNYVF